MREEVEGILHSSKISWVESSTVNQRFWILRLREFLAFKEQMWVHVEMLIY